jgi:hypothetical protein
MIGSGDRLNKMLDKFCTFPTNAETTSRPLDMPHSSRATL